MQSRRGCAPSIVECPENMIIKSASCLSTPQYIISILVNIMCNIKKLQLRLTPEGSSFWLSTSFRYDSKSEEFVTLEYLLNQNHQFTVAIG